MKWKMHFRLPFTWCAPCMGCVSWFREQMNYCLSFHKGGTSKSFTKGGNKGSTEAPFLRFENLDSCCYDSHSDHSCSILSAGRISEQNWLLNHIHHPVSRGKNAPKGWCLSLLRLPRVTQIHLTDLKRQLKKKRIRVAKHYLQKSYEKYISDNTTNNWLK